MFSTIRMSTKLKFVYVHGAKINVRKKKKNAREKWDEKPEHYLCANPPSLT